MSDDRLRRLLGGHELETLRVRLRARFERGEQRDTFTLSDITSAERRALEGLLGRAPKAARSIQLRRSELDYAIKRAGLAADLRQALELLDGEIVDRRAEQLRQGQAWECLLEEVPEQRLRALLEEPQGIALLKRCSRGDAAQAAMLLESAQRVLQALPAKGVPLAQLAAQVLGDSHALDAGQAVAALVLRACKAQVAGESADLDESDADLLDTDPGTASRADVDSAARNASTRAQWARLGVAIGELSAPVLCFNLPAPDDSPCGEVLRAAARHGEPVHLTLRALLLNPSAWNVEDVVVFVCENPSIVAAAADRLTTGCAPLVCTDGMPGAAQQTLLGQISAAGARLRYHGDFDWAGLRIANFVMREFRAAPWHFTASDYLAVASETGPRLAPEQVVTAAWDAELTAAMLARGVGVHEERVVENLLRDLAR
ncbi:MAG: TIGR02679 family protein [Gammaproteobacteria bacterium]|nr:TIGR02679 family protein [Gammaproteobacteria bacterium]